MSKSELLSAEEIEQLRAVKREAQQRAKEAVERAGVRKRRPSPPVGETNTTDRSGTAREAPSQSRGSARRSPSPPVGEAGNDLRMLEKMLAKEGRHAPAAIAGRAAALIEHMQSALNGMLRHSCVADADPRDKDAEDHEAERRARALVTPEKDPAL